jgi:hypothetical protein
MIRGPVWLFVADGSRLHSDELFWSGNRRASRMTNGMFMVPASALEGGEHVMCIISWVSSVLIRLLVGRHVYQFSQGYLAQVVVHGQAERYAMRYEEGSCIL